MDKSNTKIVIFKDNNNSVFTLKLGKSYNLSKYDKTTLFGNKKYCFKIINCVTTDIFIVEYSDPELRNTEYIDFVKIYLTFNQINE